MASLTSAQADALLDKLSSDDDFRALLLSDPESALKQIGAPVELADCFRKCKKLADPSTLKASRSAIQQQLGTTLSANIHDLRAG
ncbi:MAG TPA: NHLP-related RiPP peptide [Tahibacter sp.]|uniref:NHLP-related RiPP peptide n=1 Tax=Tahibacter sp. TaxID=2056211 RepID=UPI002BF4A7F0|nr:NHLP-related RiPP peptide [Tahibacter sp.]HSX62114.1 NHLP-related RiPP peptide [Tahibacter sp.]